MTSFERPRAFLISNLGLIKKSGMNFSGFLLLENFRPSAINDSHLMSLTFHRCRSYLHTKNIGLKPDAIVVKDTPHAIPPIPFYHPNLITLNVLV